MRLIHVAMLAALTAGAACKKEREPGAPAPKPAEPMAGMEPSQPMPPTTAAPAPSTPPSTAPPAAEPATAMTTRNVLEVATEAGNFKTFLTAVDRAGLTETLKGPGPFTIFAPTDEAFAKIPRPALDALLADKAKLTSVLTYHVVPGTYLAKDLGGLGGNARTVNGQPLKLDTTAGVKVGAANVTRSDIPAANGVIHAIDTVVFPPATTPGS